MVRTTTLVRTLHFATRRDSLRLPFYIPAKNMKHFNGQSIMFIKPFGMPESGAVKALEAPTSLVKKCKRLYSRCNAARLIFSLLRSQEGGFTKPVFSVSLAQ